jgi:hypothetical protein
MADFPLSPLPSSVSAPDVIDPMLRAVQDMGYEVRRTRHSRPRFRYTMDYLGKRTDEMRIIRNFLLQMRLGTLSFRWFHPTALDRQVLVNASSPILLTYIYQHGLFSGMWVYLQEPIGPDAALQNAWQVTVHSPQVLSLNGSTSLGSGNVTSRPFFPRAVARFSEDTWPSPAKLIGPEQDNAGAFNFSVVIEEVF